MKRLLLAFGLLHLLVLPSAFANECEMDLQYDLMVSTEALQVSEPQQILYRIRQGGYLSVKGEEVDLSAEQRALAESYAGDVGAMIPQLIALVSDALEVAGVALETAFTGLFGENSAAAQQTPALMARVRGRFDQAVKVEDGVYHLKASGLHDLDDSIGEEISDELGQAVMASLGSLMGDIGTLLLSSGDEFEERMASFEQRMELMSAELDTMGITLEDTADELCEQMRQVQELERHMVKSIPQLAPYSLFAP